MTPNREAWLQAATTALRAHFTAQGYTIPANVRSTCGWPSKSATARKKRRMVIGPIDPALNLALQTTRQAKHKGKSNVVQRLD